MFLQKRYPDLTERSANLSEPGLNKVELQLPHTYDRNSRVNSIHHQALITYLRVALEEETFIIQLDISSAFFLYVDLENEPYIINLVIANNHYLFTRLSSQIIIYI